VATKYQMQARRTDTDAMVSWRSEVPDWAATDPSVAALAGILADVALSCGGFLTTGSSGIDGQVVTASGARVLTNSGGRVLVIPRPGVQTATGSRVITAGGARVTI
jgi:hypothetical protein